MNKQRPLTIKDPLYQQIEIPRDLQEIIDSKPFQRLRYIKQLSFSDFTYPNANHTRFSHSLGAFHLMKKLIDNLEEDIIQEDREALCQTALLHDIAHGPFSHLWERVFPHFDHEENAQAIIKGMGFERAAKILRGDSNYYPLISSTLDVDKMDYMTRDSYFCGVNYGFVEVDYILKRMSIKDNKLVIKPSAISSVEDVITQRINLFKTVYYHKINIERDAIFIGIFERVKDLLEEGIKVPMNKHIKSFFTKKNTMWDLLELTDFKVLAQIQRWQSHRDSILKDLCHRFLERKCLDVVNVEHKQVNILKLKKQVQENYDTRYYFREIKSKIKLLQTPIYVEYEDGLKLLEEVSPLIKFYASQKWELHHVIFPDGVLK